MLRERPTLEEAVRAMAHYLAIASPYRRSAVGSGDAKLFQQLAALPAVRWDPALPRAAWEALRRSKAILLGLGIVFEDIPEPPRVTPQRVTPPTRQPGPAPMKPPAASPPQAAQRRPNPSARSSPRPRREWSSAREALGPGGAFAAALPGYEHREPQLQMADVVERAIARHRHALVEAGTGTGKSLAYLVPAILSRKRVIVSTANKALQEQIIAKDLPLARRALERNIHSVLLKGRSNYLCLLRLSELRQRLESGLFQNVGVFPTREAAAQWPKLDRWARQTRDGDLERSPLAVAAELRELVTIEGQNCLAARCPFQEQCFPEARKREAQGADVVVVNHALLLRDLALRQATDGEVALLPAAEVLVLDEAHQLEDEATRALGVEVSLARWSRLERNLAALLWRHPRVLKASEQSEEQLRAQQWQQKAEAIGRLLGGLFSTLRARLEQRRLLSERLGDETHAARAALAALDAFVDDLAAATPGWLEYEGEREHWARLRREVTTLATDLRLVASPGESERLVRFVALEGPDDARRLALRAAPVQVADDLRQRLFAAFRTVVATSATLATDGGFDFWRSRVGLREAEELVVPSPFDYERNALLYLPADGKALDPRRSQRGEAAAYLDRLADEIEQLLRASDGRAFCLFASKRTMEETLRRLGPRLRWPVLRQGERPRQALLSEFTGSRRAVLFGVRSFWEGVDVRGEALSLVVIDKLPFPTPDDPVWAARCEAVDRAHGGRSAWFSELALPHATLQIKQGFGRLIRSRTDRGVVALLDGRLTSAKYGERVLRALPPAPRTSSLEAVRAFFLAGQR